VPDGIYSGPGNYNIDLKAKILAIESENGPENCIIDMGSTSIDGFIFNHPNESNCVLKGLLPFKTVVSAFLSQDVLRPSKIAR